MIMESHIKFIKSTTIRIFTLLTTFFLFLESAPYAQEKAQNNVEIIFETKIDREDEINQVIYTYRRDFMPKALISENRISFLNKELEVIKEIELDEQTYACHSQNYIGLYKYTGIDKESGEIITTEFEIYDKFGSKLSSHIFDEGRIFFVSNLGDFVAFQSFEGGAGNIMYFYNAEGELLKAVRPFVNGYFSFSAAYSENGQLLIANFERLGHYGNGLILFDKNGNEKWRQQLELDKTIKLVIAPNDKAIFISGIRFEDLGRGFPTYETFCFDLQGRKLWERSEGTSAIFSPDGDYMALWTIDNELQLINTHNGDILWNYREPDIDTSINSVDISRMGNNIIASFRENPQTSKKKVHLFDKNGNKIWTKEFSDKNINADKINVKIDNEGKNFFLLYGEAVFQFTKN